MLQTKYMAFAFAALVAGCASTLSPAPVANEVAGRGEGAMVQANGVKMVARASAWEGVPSNLAAKLTPMLVTISNDSEVPVRVRYNELMLVVPEGRVYKALPPFQIDGQLAQRTIAPLYPPSRFSYAPYFSPFIPGATIYSGAFPYHRPYWDRYATVLRTVNLPSDDMLARAMPEGVIEPGGEVRGFVYFPGVGGDVEPVRLRADLVNAETGEMLVPLAIPFVVG